MTDPLRGFCGATQPGVPTTDKKLPGPKHLKVSHGPEVCARLASLLHRKNGAGKAGGNLCAAVGWLRIPSQDGSAARHCQCSR